MYIKIFIIIMYKAVAANIYILESTMAANIYFYNGIWCMEVVAHVFELS